MGVADRPTHLSQYKKHLKNVGPIRYCEPFYIVATAATVARRLRIDVHDDDNDNA